MKKHRVKILVKELAIQKNTYYVCITNPSKNNKH